MSEKVADALRDVFESCETPNRGLGPSNVVDALDSIARALSVGFKWLGTGDAATPMGALEAHGVMVKEAAGEIASGLHAVAESLERIAEAIRERD